MLSLGLRTDLHIFLTPLVLAAILVTGTVAEGQSSGRHVIDPTDRFAKLVGEVSQPNSKIVGSAFIVGREGCHIVTNFHVAFGQTKDATTGQIETFDETEVGHVVNFAFQLDAKSGQFQRSMKAKVIEYGNYQAGTKRGMVGDVAILRLESCLGKRYSNLVLDRPDRTKRTPLARLKTVSVAFLEDGKRAIVSEEGCYAERVTTVTGLFLSNCDTPPGSSGSMILEEQNGDWVLVGMPVKQIIDGTEKFSVGLFARALTKFIEDALGEGPLDGSSGGQPATVKAQSIVR